MIASDSIDELPRLSGQAVPCPLQYSLVYVLSKIDDFARVPPIPADKCQKGPFKRQDLATKPFLEHLIVNHREEVDLFDAVQGMTIVRTIPVTPKLQPDTFWDFRGPLSRALTGLALSIVALGRGWLGRHNAVP